MTTLIPTTASSGGGAGLLCDSFFAVVRERADLLFTPNARRKLRQAATVADGCVGRIPQVFRADAARLLVDYFNETAYKKGAVTAALGLEDKARRAATIMQCGLPLHASDDAIKAKADTISKNISARVDRRIKDFQDMWIEAREQGPERKDEVSLIIAESLYRQARSDIEAMGVEPHPLPHVKDPTVDDYMAVVKRALCDKWWRRKLRVAHARFVELYGMNLGHVRRDRSPYVSDATLATRRDQIQRNESLLAKLVAICDETGETMLLSDCAESSISNPENRRHETMTRLRGMEEYSTAKGFEAVFITITCPSRFHRYTTASGVVEDNPRYDGSTPRDASRYLTDMWALIRTAFDDYDLSLAGFRICEPHHDGCPHWHLLVFGDAPTLAEATEIMRRYSLADSPDEPGASRTRFKAEPIDTAKGSAVGYVAKYIAKHLDGKGMEGQRDESALRIDLAIARVDAWRSLWGIRQFQFFGTSPVTVWRELRRLSEKPQGAIAKAWTAAQSADFGGAEDGVCYRAFLDALAENPICIARRAQPEPGYYGEAIEEIVGLECGGAFYLTRTKRWLIYDAAQAAALGLVSITVDGGVTLIPRGEPPPP